MPMGKPQQNPISGVKNSSTTAFATTASITLDPAVIAPGDSVTCRITATDGYSGTDANATTVSVQNTDPTVTTPAITPVSAFNDSRLTRSATGNDVDDGALTVSYTWTNRSTTASLGTGSAITLTSADASPGDKIECTGSVTDSFGTSVTATTHAILGNRNPVVSAVTITPNTGVTTSTTLTCAGSGYDDDDDSITWSRDWNYTGYSTGTLCSTERTDTLVLTAASVQPGWTVTCSAKATDEHGLHGVLSSNVTIDNSSPTVDTISLTPATKVATNSVLTCVATASDPDDDGTGSGAPTLTYAWKNVTQGTDLSSSASVVSGGSELILTTSMVDPFDAVQCEAIARDSGGKTDTQTTSVNIANTDPIMGSVSITPNPAYNNSTLTCAGSGSDIDDGALTPTCTWENTHRRCELSDNMYH